MHQTHINTDIVIATASSIGQWECPIVNNGRAALTKSIIATDDTLVGRPTGTFSLTSESAEGDTLAAACTGIPHAHTSTTGAVLIHV